MIILFLPFILYFTCVYLCTHTQVHVYVCVCVHTCLFCMHRCQKITSNIILPSILFEIRPLLFFHCILHNQIPSISLSLPHFSQHNYRCFVLCVFLRLSQLTHCIIKLAPAFCLFLFLRQQLMPLSLELKIHSTTPSLVVLGTQLRVS